MVEQIDILQIRHEETYHHACPTSFHVVRTHFFGNIATPKLGVSPFRTIESLWGGNLPEFDDASAANKLFEALMGLWNELAKHQSGTKPRRGHSRPTSHKSIANRIHTAIPFYNA